MPTGGFLRAEEQSSAIPSQEAHFKLRSEDQVLLHCVTARCELTDENGIRELVHGSIDWTYLLESAQQHGLLPLLYWHLREACPDTPIRHLEILEECYRRTDARNILMIHELLRVLDLLKHAQIPVIPFRGPALTQAIYGSFGVREFNALNLLLPPKHILRAKDLLVKERYRPAYTLNFGQELAQVRFRHLFQLDRPEDRSHIWLHSEVEPGNLARRFSFEVLRNRITSVMLLGREVAAPSPEHLLIILCLYICKPIPLRLCAIADLANHIARHDDLDWAYVIETAEALGCRQRLLYALALARVLTRVSIPGRISEHLYRHRTLEKAKRDAEALFAKSGSTAGRAAIFRRQLGARDSWRDKIHFGVKTALMPTEDDISLFDFPKHLVFLLPFFRPIRLAANLMGFLQPRRLAPFMPAPLEAAQRMLALAGVGPGDVVYDIGCGDGRIVIMAAEQFGARGVGVDIDSGRVEEAQAAARTRGIEHLVTFRRQNVLEMDLSAATVVTLYMGAGTNLLLRPKLQNDLRDGTRIVSLTYDMGDWQPLKTELVSRDGGMSQIYLWKIAKPETAAFAHESRISDAH